MHTTRNDRYSSNTAHGAAIENRAWKTLAANNWRPLKRNGYEFRVADKQFWLDLGMVTEANQIQNAPDFASLDNCVLVEVKSSKSISRDCYNECLRLSKLGYVVWLMRFKEVWLVDGKRVENVFLMAKIENVIIEIPKNPPCPVDPLDPRWLQPSRLPPEQLAQWRIDHGSGDDYGNMDTGNIVWEVLQAV